MSTEIAEPKILPHHEQQRLCTTRAPYRQGRKLTAVKVYTINTESNHLLVFGVPALNLRRETKALFLKFGNLLQFHISKDHPNEAFTETYHAKYDRIHSARVAKRMLDTKNFYGGSLHVCYAPELETLDETRKKLMQRRKDVIYRLRNLDKEKSECINTQDRSIEETNVTEVKEIGPCLIQNEVKQAKNKMNMGEENIIYLKKRKAKNVVVQKKFKPYSGSDRIEVVDLTSTEKGVVSNINEGLNYNKFGNEVIREVVAKPVNTIRFNKKS